MAHVRRRGRKFKEALPELGDCVACLKTPPRGGCIDLGARWKSGVFVEMGDASLDHIIGSRRGAIKSRESRRGG
eukprot:6998945-Pyramimonas_sp.AAC.1